ncbi:hypothetical protein K0M31_012520, partial [Melipona bicolor]
ELEDMWDQWFAGHTVIRNAKGPEFLQSSSNGNIIVVDVREAHQTSPRRRQARADYRQKSQPRVPRVACYKTG